MSISACLFSTFQIIFTFQSPTPAFSGCDHSGFREIIKCEIGRKWRSGIDWHIQKSKTAPQRHQSDIDSLCGAVFLPSNTFSLTLQQIYRQIFRQMADLVFLQVHLLNHLRGNRRNRGSGHFRSRSCVFCSGHCINSIIQDADF